MAVWKQRDFRKSGGMPMQHAEQIGYIITAMMHPKYLAIIKCQAHKKVNDFVIMGNNATELEARKASDSEEALLAPMVLEGIAFKIRRLLMNIQCGSKRVPLEMRIAYVIHMKGTLLHLSHFSIFLFPMHMVLTIF